jgi:hypothetical protein
MGRRSRKRGPATAEPTPAGPASARPGRRPDAAAPRHAAPRGHRAPMAEAPKAPWSPFPLVELCVLIGIVLIVLGFVSDGSRRGVLLACGIALASLAGLELAIREHFAGFRSHTALLAAAAAVIVDVSVFFLTDVPQIGLLAVGAFVYTLAFVALRRAFQARTGGIGFRV